MFAQTLRIFFAGALFIHGVAHILGFWMPARSWLFPNISVSLARVISSVFWIVSAVGFVGAAFSFLGVIIPPDRWPPLSIWAVCISLTGLGLFGKQWALVNLMGALAMNLCIITVIFFQSVV